MPLGARQGGKECGGVAHARSAPLWRCRALTRHTGCWLLLQVRRVEAKHCPSPGSSMEEM